MLCHILLSTNFSTFSAQTSNLLSRRAFYHLRRGARETSGSGLGRRSASSSLEVNFTIQVSCPSLRRKTGNAQRAIILRVSRKFPGGLGSDVISAPEKVRGPISGLASAQVRRRRALSRTPRSTPTPTSFSRNREVSFDLVFPPALSGVRLLEACRSHCFAVPFQ